MKAVMEVVVDPGHGGKDPGACAYGLKESELVLVIAKKLKDALEKYNVIVYMAREVDEYISLQDRTKKANALNVDLYLSVHINSADNKNASGVEVLYYDNHSFAQDIANKMCAYTGANNRGAKKRTDLYVLNSTSMNAVLVECGFISNNTEAAYMTDSNYQDKLVKGIVEAMVSKYNIALNTKDEEYKKAVTTLTQVLNINNTAWYPEPNKKNLVALVQKIGRYMYGIGDYKFIITRLSQDGIITSTSLWQEHEYSEENIKSLVKKVAARLG